METTLVVRDMHTDVIKIWKMQGDHRYLEPGDYVEETKVDGQMTRYEFIRYGSGPDPDNYAA